MKFSKIILDGFSELGKTYSEIAKKNGFSDEDIQLVLNRSKEEFARKPRRILDLF